MRLTDPAVEDLRALFKADPQIVRRAFKKLLHLETDPYAGEPLLGGLVGYRKITVGDRDWRLVWRVVEDETGGLLVEVAEVWAVGYRKDGEVYDEVRRRVAQAGPSPATEPFSTILGLFAKQAKGLAATPEPVEVDPVPLWLAQALTRVVGLPREQVAQMTLAEAERAWADYTSGPGSAT